MVQILQANGRNAKEAMNDSISQLQEIENQLASIDIDRVWSEAKPWGLIEFVDLGPDFPKNERFKCNLLTQPSKTGRSIDANNINGVYGWWCHSTDLNLYIGKAASRTTSPHTRQKNHMRSFEKPNETNESTGRKIREYMSENNLQKLVIVVKYIETYDLASSLEDITIKKYKPLLNGGRGSRK